jgi:hypothetical protein
MHYCSPVKTQRKGNGCFSKESLIKLIDTWNKINPNNKIIIKDSFSNKKLWTLLNDKMKNIYNDKDDWCWTTALDNMTTDTNDKKYIKGISKELRPEKPVEWNKNPRTWLSNYDIDKVMKQYESNKNNKFKFLGVFPIDFTVKDKFGKCLFSELCHIDIKDHIKKKIKFIGLITNLDKHNEPGSHWTSTFIIIDPKLKSYGAYYYDSTAKQIPLYVFTFLKDIKKQLNEIYPTNNFKITYNKKQHQRKNTECGMFSLLFQIRWLNYIKQNKDITFDDIINDPDIEDEHVFKLRDVLFRPNVKSIIKNKNV